MKIPHLVYCDKSNLNNIQESITDVNRKKCPESRAKPPVKVLDNSKSALDRNIKIYDKIDGLINWNITADSICIAGDNKEICSVISYLAKYVSCSRKSRILNDFHGYIKSKNSTLNRLNINSRLSIICVNTEKIIPEYIYQAVNLCKRSFLFRPQNMMVFCPVSDRYRVNGYAMAVISSFAEIYGEDKKELQERMYAAEENEFIDFGSGSPRVRRLPKNLGYKRVKIHQIKV